MIKTIIDHSLLDKMYGVSTRPSFKNIWPNNRKEMRYDASDKGEENGMIWI